VNQHPLLLVAKQKMKIGDEGKATEAATWNPFERSPR
jgi:hypothetical protein